MNPTFVPAPGQVERPRRGSPRRNRRDRLRAAVLVTATACALAAAVPASGAPSPAGPVQAQQADSTCFTDPAGDTIDFDTRAAAAQPRGDLVEHCANFGATLSLTAQVASPQNPRTDPHWTGATSLIWFLDTDADGSGEFAVTYGLDAAGVLTARVSDVRGGTGTQTCVVTASYTGLYAASGIAPSCIGGATSARSSPGLFYDTTPTAGAAGVVTIDVAPDDGGFTAPVTGGQARTSGRLAGATRIGTAVAISQEAFPTPPVSSVYLARSDVLADAVVGGALTDGPILLVPRCAGVPGEVAAEIGRLDPDRVVALGGPQAVCTATLAAAGTGRTTARLAGATRIGTAAAIARASFPGTATTVYLARADIFPDAVAGGALTDGPVLLVPRCAGVPGEVATEIGRLDPDNVIALGGQQAVCTATLTAAGAGRTLARLAGTTRTGTAIAISQRAFTGTADDVFLARADIFPDAVAGGILTTGPILLVPRCGTLPDEVAGEISRVAPGRVMALGGPNAICTDVLAAAAAS